MMGSFHLLHLDLRPQDVVAVVDAVVVLTKPYWFG
jgi:hypothetical protein